MARPCLVGKLVTELEVNCNADKYYEISKHHKDMPKAIPSICVGVKVIEGHGITSGCVKQWDYIHEGKTMHVHEKTTYSDETRTIFHSSIGGDVLKDYNKFDATLVINPKADGHGSIVSWTIDYEKNNEDTRVPFDYLALFHQKIEYMNTYLCASE